MANASTVTLTRTTSLAQDALTGTGTAVDVTGANDVLVCFGSRGTSVAGITILEESFDGGQNWSAITCTRLNDGTTASSTSAAETGVTFLVPPKDGPRQIRCRVTTNYTTASPIMVVVKITR